MRKEVDEYVRNCDPCQRRKADREYVVQLGEIQEPATPFEVTSMDITGPYLQTPRGINTSSHLLTTPQNT